MTIFIYLKKNGTIVNSSILTNNNFFDFNLTSGTYTYEVTTEDGCPGTGSIEIRESQIS
jgi:hypothetical protein